MKKSKPPKRETVSLLDVSGNVGEPVKHHSFGRGVVFKAPQTGNPPAPIASAVNRTGISTDWRATITSEFRIVPGVGKGYDRKLTLLPLDETNLILVVPHGVSTDSQLVEKSLVVITEVQPGQYVVTKTQNTTTTKTQTITQTENNKHGMERRSKTTRERSQIRR